MIRVARGDEAGRLLAVERAATIAAFQHIFPAERYPYPSDDVLARWELNLARDDMTVYVSTDAADDTDVTGYAAIASQWLEHLGILPALWGTGLADDLHTIALEELHRRGHSGALLWVLEENERAQRFYLRRGWSYTGQRGEAEFAPHPAEVQMRRALP